MLFWWKKRPQAVWPVWTATTVVFALKSLFVLFTSIRGLASTTWLIDDSFIEMKIARNLALGSGFSLDGIHPTTGAPFFWIYLSSLNHLLLGKDAAIRATLIETNVLGALATVLVFFLALKLTENRRVAWTAWFLSTFTANAALNGLNGMDTALFTFFVLLAVATYFGVGKPATWSALRWGCVTGLAAGLAVMTRGDGLFLLGSLGLVKIYEWWRSPRHERFEHGKSLFGMVLVAGLCFAFFMGWQLLQTGSPFPGNQVGRRSLALDLHGYYFDEFNLQYIKIVLWNIFQLEEILSIAVGSLFFGLVALLFGMTQRKLRMLSFMTVLYLGVFFALLVGYQWYFANLHGLRYINPAAHLLFIFMAALLWELPLHRWRTVGAVGLTVALVVLASYKHYQMVSRLPWVQYMSYVARPSLEPNRVFWHTVDWIQGNLPPGTIVGVRDYGRVSLFTDVRVQDLAGNVDPPVAAALQNGTLQEYLREKNVEYLLIPTLEQRPDKLYQYLHGNLQLREVREATSSPNLPKLYKIIW